VAHQALLLQVGELELLSGAGGRGNTNVWQVRASVDTPARVAAGSPARRVVPPAGTRPLLATVASSAAENRPALTGVPVGTGGQDRTLFNETPAETPARQKPRRPARAGRNGFNPRTPEDPPSPPAGGSRLGSMIVEQAYTPASAVAAGADRSASASPRSVEASACPVPTTAPTGIRFGRCCSKPSAKPLRIADATCGTRRRRAARSGTPSRSARFPRP
jgi:hypothetical protein